MLPNTSASGLEIVQLAQRNRRQDYVCTPRSCIIRSDLNQNSPFLFSWSRWVSDDHCAHSVPPLYRVEAWANHSRPTYYRSGQTGSTLQSFPLNALVQSQPSSAHTPFATLRATKNTARRPQRPVPVPVLGGRFWWAGIPPACLRSQDQPAHHKTPTPVSPQLEPPKIPLLLDGRAPTSPSLSSITAIIATSPLSLSCVPLLSHLVAASVYCQASSISTRVLYWAL